jgi:hypothetical protein
MGRGRENIQGTGNVSPALLWMHLQRKAAILQISADICITNTLTVSILPHINIKSLSLPILTFIKYNYYNNLYFIANIAGYGMLIAVI